MTCRARSSHRHWTLVLLLLCLAVATGACGGDSTRPQSLPTQTAAARHVGQAVCAECHPRESELWQASDHRRAMEPADRALGNFQGAALMYNGIRSTFFTENGRPMVRTDGPDGQLRTYPIAYTFGVTPLQQYLVALPGGRYQALSLAWDSRPRQSGGQRWFHLYPRDKVDHRDVLHWTRPGQNWNFMCADCHSTNVEKRYDAAADRFDTRWSDMNVSCEACHGPGSRHVGWARQKTRSESGDPLKGLVFSMKDTSRGQWVVAAGAAIAQRSAPLSSRAEVETCARCHARAARLWPAYEHGRPLADSHRVALLDEGLYESDGQIRDEVYEYGSFLQSRMYQAGVTCSNCHNPHSGKLVLKGNSLCAQCHLPDKYDRPTHHFHKIDTAGAACVACHMPERRYMVVDDRRDHSFRIPRPDESVRLGTPNACTSCHTRRSASWAAASLQQWHGPGAAARPTFTAAFHAGRSGHAEGAALLASLVSDRQQPAIVRATALTLLARYSSDRVRGAIAAAAGDPEPLVRRAAAESLGSIDDPVSRARIGGGLLADSVRAVRVEAIPALAGAPRVYFSAAGQQAFDAAVAEYREVQRFNADRAESYVNLGTLEAQLGRPAEAEAALRTAIARQPLFVPAYVNLADVLRASGREADAERVLRDAIAAVPGAADAYHALGLALVRQNRLPEALEALARAAVLAPGDPRFTYVLAVALHDTGQVDRSIAMLESHSRAHPGDADILRALALYAMERGDVEATRRWASRLAQVAPDDALVVQLRRQRALE